MCLCPHRLYIFGQLYSFKINFLSGADDSLCVVQTHCCELYSIQSFFRELPNYSPCFFFRIILNKAKSESAAKRTHMRAYVHSAWGKRNLSLNLLSFSFVSHCAPCNVAQCIPRLLRMCRGRLPWLWAGRTTNTLNIPLWIIAAQHSHSAQANLILLDIHRHKSRSYL